MFGDIVKQTLLVYIYLDNCHLFLFLQSNNYFSNSCMSPNTQLRKNHFLPESSNQFIVSLPKFKVARVLNEKIFLEAIPKSVQYTTRDEYDYDDVRYMTSRHNGMVFTAC